MRTNRAPSLKRLESAFPGKGAELRALLKGERKTRSYASVQALEAACYNPPGYVYRLMTALNEVLDGYGIECLWRRGEGPDSCHDLPFAEYINFGDAYDITIVRKVETGTIIITSWGDFAESNRL
jgi:hypothetical protein